MPFEVEIMTLLEPSSNLEGNRTEHRVFPLPYLILQLNMHKQSRCSGIQPLLPQAMGLAVKFYQLLLDRLSLAFDILVTGSTVQSVFFSSH